MVPVNFSDPSFKTIVLAGGCFWGVQAYMSRLKGVVFTECAYANGNVKDPTYEVVCYGTTGYVEAVKVIYDPNTMPLPVLLHEFFKIIDPTSLNKQGGDIGTQYRTGIYYLNEDDIPAINQVITEEQAKYNKPIVTEVEKLSSYYPAEEYHQNYLEKNPNGYCHVDLNLLPNN